MLLILSISPASDSCSFDLEVSVAVQETSIARRWPRGRTHFAGTRRILSSTLQAVSLRPATLLGEVNWTGSVLRAQIRLLHFGMLQDHVRGTLGDFFSVVQDKHSLRDPHD